MIKAHVKFYGEDRDEYGMPITFHSYLILASPWERIGSGFAEAIAMSSETPLPNPPMMLVLDGGPVKALDKLIVKLRQLPGNADLIELIDKDTSDT